MEDNQSDPPPKKQIRVCPARNRESTWFDRRVVGIFGYQQEMVADTNRVGPTVGGWTDLDVRYSSGSLYLYVVLGS
ncbi:MAG: hypothetical protein CM1200mP25_2380 [Acidobacteriota bacterium]|nr:MAG: hypothetical protein CM1200mP25_2380 [Acidobacteriota bacterium]